MDFKRTENPALFRRFHRNLHRNNNADRHRDCLEFSGSADGKTEIETKKRN